MMNCSVNRRLSPTDRLTKALDNPFWLAPLAGFSDAPFRGLCRRLGAGLSCTEMISAKGLHYDGRAGLSRNRTRELLAQAPEESEAFTIQLFGAEPDLMAEQAAVLAERFGANLACIDVNMGCPMLKVVRRGEGAALMKTPELAEDIVRAMTEALVPYGIPLSVKFRLGYEENEPTAADFAQRMEAAGAALITIHGRYARQFYHGLANLEPIMRIAEACTVPVFASGDIMTPEIAVSLIRDTALSGVLVARGALGHPWIFRDIALLRTKGTYEPLSYRERFALIRAHAEAVHATYGEKGVIRFRSHLMYYVHGLPGAVHIRRQASSILTFEELFTLLADYLLWIEESTKK